MTKEFVHVMHDCDEPLMPLEEPSTSEVDSGEIDALITNFETLSNTTEESCPIDEEEAVRTLVTWKESRQNLNVAKRDRNFSQTSNSQTPAPDTEQIRRRTRCFRCRRIGHFSKDCPERLQKKPVTQTKVLETRDDLSARRQTKTLDELLLEIEQLSQERASHVSVEPDDEEETCLMLHESGKAIIDTGCGRCVIGALTLEARQSVMGDQAKEIVWHCDTPSVVFYDGNGTKDRSIGVIDLPCVVGGLNMQIKMHVVPGEVPFLLSKSWLKENGTVLNTSSEELLLTKKQITAPMSEGPSGHFELDLCSREGFWRGSDQNPEAIVYVESGPRFEGFAQHTFESFGDLLENHDPEMLALPAEQYLVIGEPKTLLRKRQVKQLLSTTERILEMRAITIGSDISLASFF